MTVKRIAQIADISKTTVLKALHDQPGVAPGTRRRILAIADEIGYHPQASGRSLATGKSETIGFVSPKGYPYGSDELLGPLGGMVEVLEARCYRTAVFHIEPTERLVPNGVLRRAVDGMVFMLSWPPRLLEELRDRNIPALIALPLGHAPADYDSVAVDDLAGARTAVRHLLHLGHRRIAYVPSWEEWVEYPNHLRWRGYVEEMSQVGFPVYPGGASPQPLPERIHELFHMNSPPTALVCLDDLTAVATVGELRTLGLDVPEDVSVVAFDDSVYGRHVRPALSTMRVPFGEVGARAANMILERLEKPDLPPRRVVLNEELVPRESTAPPRADPSS